MRSQTVLVLNELLAPLLHFIFPAGLLLSVTWYIAIGVSQFHLPSANCGFERKTCFGPQTCYDVNKHIFTTHHAASAQISNQSTHCAQAPSTVSGSLVAHQHTSLVVFFSAVNKETLCLIVPFDLISTSVMHRLLSRHGEFYKAL